MVVDVHDQVVLMQDLGHDWSESGVEGRGTAMALGLLVGG